MLVTRVTLVRAADPFTRSSSDSLWMLPLQQQPALFQECFPFLHLNSLKSPLWGIVKGKEKERQGEEEEEEEEEGAQSIVEKTESLWMEGMESLESAGLYLILVSQQPMSNGEKGITVGDNPTHGSSEGGSHPGSTCLAGCKTSTNKTQSTQTLIFLPGTQSR